MAVVRKIARIIAIVIAALLIIGCGVSFFATDGEAESFTVHGDQYSPMINNGALVGVKAIPMTDIEVGDLFSYIDPEDEDEQRVIFRVTGVDEGTRTVEGVNEHDNTEVSYDYGYCEGKVVYCRAGWAYYYDFFGNILPILCAFIVAVLLFLFSIEPQTPDYERDKRAKARAKAHR